MITLFDRYGAPIAYSDDMENIYLFSGEPLAYILGDSVYAFRGAHLGWFIDGWVRDHNGDAVFFTEISKNGPFKPFKQFKPFKSLKLLKPLKGLRELKPLRPINSLSWSSLSGEDFFNS